MSQTLCLRGFNVAHESTHSLLVFVVGEYGELRGCGFVELSGLQRDLSADSYRRVQSFDSLTSLETVCREDVSYLSGRGVPLLVDANHLRKVIVDPPDVGSIVWVEADGENASSVPENATCFSRESVLV